MSSTTRARGLKLNGQHAFSITDDQVQNGMTGTDGTTLARDNSFDPSSSSNMEGHRRSDKTTYTRAAEPQRRTHTTTTI
jgi:hypothetical protein